MHTAKISMLLGLCLSLSSQLVAMKVEKRYDFEFGEDSSPSFKYGALQFEFEGDSNSLEGIREIIDHAQGASHTCMAQSDYNALQFDLDCPHESNVIEEIIDHVKNASIACAVASENEFNKYISKYTNQSTNRFHVFAIIEAGFLEFNKFLKDLENKGISIELQRAIKDKIVALREKFLGSWGFVTIDDAFQAMVKLSNAASDAIQMVVDSMTI